MEGMEARDAPLRRDVRLLGDLLGRVLVEQEGESLLADVERVRALARASRAGSPHEELQAAVEALPLERQASVLRAFALYFQLANVAEQHHRVRRLRAYKLEERVPAESLDDSFARLDGVPPAELERRVSLQLVLTAHPTEATRRTVLASHLRIAALLEELDDPMLAAVRRAEIEASLAGEITAQWQADEVRSRRPRVVDEIRNGHWFFEQSLIDASERLLADYRRLLPGRAAAHALGHVDRRGRRRESECGRGDDHRGARPRAAAAPASVTATRCARLRPRSASRRGSHPSTTTCSRRSSATSASWRSTPT